MSICGLCNWLWIWLGFKLKSHIFFPWGLDICSCTMFLPWRVLPGRLIPEWTFLQQVTRHCLDAYRIFSLSLKSISTGCVSVLSSEHQLFLKWCVLSVCKFKSAFISIKCPIFTIVGQSLSHVWLCDPMDCSMPGLSRRSPSPRPCSNSCPLSQWYHSTISSSVVPFSFYLSQNQGLF